MTNKYPKVSVGLCNPKSPENVGSVLRAAGNYRVDSVFYTGQRYERALKLNPDIPNVSRKVSENVSIVAVESLINYVPKDLKIIIIKSINGNQLIGIL